MLSGGRVQLGGGHALQQKFDIKDTPDQMFRRLGARSTTAKAATATATWCASSPTRTSPTYRLPDRQRRRVHREADPVRRTPRRVPRIFVTKEWHIPSRGDRAASQPQRLGPGAAARGKRAQEGRADPAQAQDDRDRARAAERPARCSASSCRPAATTSTSSATQGRHHRDRRPHRQRQLPPHVRSAADRGIPAGLRALRPPGRRRRARRDGDRRVAVGDRATRPPRRGAAITKTRHIGCRWGYSSLVYETDSPMFPLAQRHRPHREGLAGHDHRQPVRQAVLERGRRLATSSSTPRWRYNGDKNKLNGGGPIWAIFDADGGRRARSGSPKPPHVDPDGYFFSADTHRRAGRQDQESLPEAADVRRGAAGDGRTATTRSSPTAPTRTSRSRRRCTRSRSRRSTRRGRRRSCTTR